MPRGDGTGPAGEGPMTGRRLGYCAGNDRPGYTEAERGFAGGGRFRSGFSRRGPGFARGGLGMGRGRGFARRANAQPVQDTNASSEDGREYDILADLREQMKDIQGRLEKLE